jgi:CRP-like cAMP-binding protein
VQLYWTFWHALSKKLRGMNAQLQSFFDPGALPENFLRLRRPQRVLSDAVKVDSSDKIRLFREQGLSRRELMTLATFSEEKRFPENAYVFQEGDQGTELYVVLEGRVIICKYIPGGGEEALAILDRGDFFGEMSLLDGEPRSADARAHGGPLTVLALDEARVREVLSMDAAAAVEFLRLLCRLLADRLREIDDKVIGWRILAGGQAETVSA